MPNCKSFLITDDERKQVRWRARFQQHLDASCHQVFSFLQGKVPKEFHAILTKILGEHAPSYATVKNWVAHVKRGGFSTRVTPRPGRPKNSDHPGDYWSNSRDNLGRPTDLAKSIAEQLGISLERVGSIIHEDLDMRSTPRSGSRNAWRRLINVNCVNRLSNI